MSSLVLTVSIVLELNLSKQRMSFPIIFNSVQETKESEVRKFTSNEGILFNYVLKCFIFVKKSYPFQLICKA